MNVYILKPVHDDPRFNSFAPQDGQKRYINLFYDNIKGDPVSDKWQPGSWKKTWIPFKAYPEGRIRDNDYPAAFIGPVFSPRALSVLRESLEKSGELLPMDIEGYEDEYMMYNCIAMPDALDLEKSKLVFSSAIPEHVMAVDHYIFKEDKLIDFDIFCIRQDKLTLFVTQDFVDKVEKAGLVGFSFELVFPVPEDIGYIKYNRMLRQQAVEEKSMISCSIEVYLGKAKGAKGLTEVVEDIQDSLVAVLDDPNRASSQEAIVGDVVGYDELKDSYRLLLSCPDINPLVQVLKEYFQTRDWAGKIGLKTHKRPYDELVEEPKCMRKVRMMKWIKK